MELYILATSISLQLGAVVVAGLIAWTTLRRSWILIAFAIFLMAVRRGISFYQVFLLEKGVDLATESVALLISLLMLWGFIGLLLRERSLLVIQETRTTPLSFRSPGAIAALLGVVIVVGVSIVAYYSFAASRNALIQNMFSANLTIAQLLSRAGDSPNPSLSALARTKLIEDIWNTDQSRYAGSYLCIINSRGELDVHTGNPPRGRTYIGDMPIADGTQRFSTIDSLLDSKADWVGWYVSASGESQIAAFSYNKALASLIAVHVPQKAVEREILLGILPLALGLLFILAILLPAALGVLYRAYSMALREVESSGERFSKVFYGHPTPMSIFSLEGGDRLYFNESFCHLTGYTRDELLDTSVFTLSLWTDPEAQKAAFEQLKADGYLRNFPLKIRVKSGELKSALGTAVVLDIGGRSLVVSSVVDITALKTAQAEKSEQDARSAAVIENAVDGIITIDEEGIIESVNPAAETLFGYTRSELLGQNVEILMPDPHRSKHNGYLTRYLESGIPRMINSSRDVPGQRKDGTHFPLKVSVSEVRFSDRRLFCGVVHDLTRETELEQQLLQAQKMDALGTLAGGIAHDFNNILQAILGFNRMALENINGDEETLAQSLQEIERGALRAADLVSQILTFSRTADIEFSPLALQPLLEEALRFLRSSIPATVRIDTRIDGECAQVRGNATQIHQVLTNLSTNAMHAMEENGGVLTISLESVTTDAPLETLSGVLEAGVYVQLAVADTGVGIPPEMVNQILDPFFTTKEVGKGTGLGLSMVHGIIRSMGGGMSIESTLKKGTTVRLMFPVLEKTRGSQSDSTPAAFVESCHRSSDGRRRVLIVDDEVSITDLTTLMLESRGYTVDAYNDVDRALEVFQSDPTGFDMVILDYTMPKKTGIELAEDINAINPEIPVILATGVLDKSSIDPSSNIVAVIKKPFRAKHLLESLARYI